MHDALADQTIFLPRSAEVAYIAAVVDLLDATRIELVEADR